MSEPGRYCPGAQLGGPRGLAAQPGSARLVPAGLRAALLPEIPVAHPVRGCRAAGGIPDQVRIGGCTAPGAGPDPRRASPGRLRRRLCAAERGPAAGPARGGSAPDRIPDAVAAQRPAARPAADGAAPGSAGANAEVGPQTAAAPPGRPLDPEV